MNEYEGSFLLKSPSSYSLYTQHSKTGNVYILVIGNMQRFTSQIFGIVGPLGENLNFFLVRWDLTFLSQKPKNQALLSQSLKRYLNEKNLIHGRVMATISKFSPQIFETYFSFIHCLPTLKSGLLLL